MCINILVVVTCVVIKLLRKEGLRSIEAKMFQVILVLALFAHAINGQSEICNTTRYSFFNDFPECLLAFEGAALNASVGYEVDDETVYLICANETCQTAITDYVHSCGSEEVSGLNSLIYLIVLLSMHVD